MQKNMITSMKSTIMFIKSADALSVVMEGVGSSLCISMANNIKPSDETLVS